MPGNGGEDSSWGPTPHRSRFARSRYGRASAARFLPGVAEWRGAAIFHAQEVPTITKRPKSCTNSALTSDDSIGGRAWVLAQSPAANKAFLVKPATHGDSINSHRGAALDRPPTQPARVIGSTKARTRRIRQSMRSTSKSDAQQ